MCHRGTHPFLSLLVRLSLAGGVCGFQHSRVSAGDGGLLTSPAVAPSGLNSMASSPSVLAAERVYGPYRGRTRLEASLAQGNLKPTETVGKHRAVTAAGVASRSQLEEMETKIVAALKKVSPAVVGLRWRRDGRWYSASGVIVSASGHVVTYRPNIVASDSLHGDEKITFYLADGRRVAGRSLGALGVYPSWIGLLQIECQGPWPYAEIGQSIDRKPGDLCICLGRMQQGLDGSEPSFRLARIWHAAGPLWLRTSCECARGQSGGSGLFDMDGRLIALSFRDLPLFGTNHLALDAYRSRVSALRTGSQADASGKGAPDVARLPATRPDVRPVKTDPRIMAAFKRARPASVWISRKHTGGGGSGTIVTPDGYVATCAQPVLARRRSRNPPGRRASRRRSCSCLKPRL